ncbi:MULTISPECIES: response regulator [Limnospira]|uniref:Two-component response regulator:response regulator receiver protein n=1 Tax=Limnospira indica PCC 8005 TaxID=376219 RepID=A0A9P1NZL4_9CYAN|nr:response regulator [Limnospira indica]QJB26531.1 response regulator [Limnospira fusiformis SAG 85.79]CDM95332.1 Two-component response regulator:response regulator receiver protein [Limnospira indica PCC 8005]
MISQTVLIIDDDEDILLVTESCLQLQGKWQVLTAASGTEGFTIAKQQQPDVILLDLVMPGVDGEATIKMLKNDIMTAEIPVILMTANNSPKQRSLYLGLGAIAIINKPFEPLEISDQISNALGN